MPVQYIHVRLCYICQTYLLNYACIRKYNVLQDIMCLYLILVSDLLRNITDDGWLLPPDRYQSVRDGPGV